MWRKSDLLYRKNIGVVDTIRFNIHYPSSYRLLSWTRPRSRLYFLYSSRNLALALHNTAHLLSFLKYKDSDEVSCELVFKRYLWLGAMRYVWDIRFDFGLVCAVVCSMRFSWYSLMRSAFEGSAEWRSHFSASCVGSTPTKKG